MSEEKRIAYGDELYDAMRARRTVSPLTERWPEITTEDAYHVSLRMVQRRLADGERIVGKKIGVTSKVVQEKLNVFTPDFGFLTDRMEYQNGEDMPISRELIQPRAEGEIAFRLGKDLVGPGVTEADVLAATDHVMACFEIVDSRIAEWKIKYQDTVADNASCGLYVLGADKADPRKLDLPSVKMTVQKNGKFLSEGYGSAALGSPLTCVAWLANTLGQFGIKLEAGDVVLSGSLVPLEPVVGGDVMSLHCEGIGGCSVRFV
ncbi:MAG: fumarylacetoacetate hydrolase family protein [Polyangiales bacterium]